MTEPAEPPAITPVRRLHLAAERGGRFGPAPLGLLLPPGTGGAQGIENRWHLARAHTSFPHDLVPHDLPEHSPPPGPAGDGAAKTRKCWTLQRLRARTLPPCSWQIAQAAGSSLLRPASCRPAIRTAAPHAQDGPQHQDDALPRPQAVLAAPAHP
ncbi:hypothetical protein [Leisingera sp. F5]|uniref:hypothetical protein n=1 Tax=Leisingera sp. F5 TaxID=1813816 RepID=UPI0025BF088D|nr:hypothetical protein [Leisingera sp. F5]